MGIFDFFKKKRYINNKIEQSENCESAANKSTYTETNVENNVTLRDFFKPYYNKNGLNIMCIKSLDWYFLMSNTGQIADETVVYKFTKEEVDRLIAGKIRVEDVISDSQKGFVLSKYEECFSDKHMEEIARREATVS